MNPPVQIPFMNGKPYGQQGGLAPGSVPSFDGVSVLGGTAMRNRMVNGDFRIDQVNAGAVVVCNSVVTQRGPDKWRPFGAVAAGVFSLQQANATPPPGFTNYLALIATTADAAPAAGTIYALNANIEGTYMQDMQFGLAANVQQVTLSFWMRSSLTGLFSGSLRNNGGARSFPFTFNYVTAATWQWISVTFPVDTAGAWLTTAGVGMQISIDLGCGANSRGAAGSWQAINVMGVTGAVALLGTLNATLDLTGFQLEPGSAATNFEQIPLDESLRRCQREFQKSFGQVTAPVQNVGTLTGEQRWQALLAGALTDRCSVTLPVVMRAVPVITLLNPSGANAQVRDESAAADCAASGTQNIVDRYFEIFTTGAAGTAVGNTLGVHWTADARL